jgi:hypothetical protein
MRFLFGRRQNARRARAPFGVTDLESRLAPATVMVNASANVRPTDPNIYGTAYARTAQLLDLNAPLNRNGVTPPTPTVTSRGSDWYFESIGWGSAAGNGEGMDAWINQTLAGEEDTGPAVMQLDWARPGQTDFASIPPANLFSAPTIG